MKRLKLLKPKTFKSQSIGFTLPFVDINSTKQQHFIFHNSTEQQWKESLKVFGNVDFDSDIWFLDKKMKNLMSKNSTKIYFSKVNRKYKNLLKFYIVYKLNKGISVSKCNISIYSINKLLTFLEKENLELYELKKIVLVKFYEYLNNLTYVYKGNKKYLSKNTKNITWNECNNFIRFIIDFANYNILSDIFANNPYKLNIKNEYKYIPDNILNQLDIVFRRTDLPRYIDVFYWIARSIPSRAGEIIGMKLDCLKPYGNDSYVLFIPTWKQNGGYVEAQIRRIYLKNTGHSKFLIDLIKKQQKYAKSIQDCLEEEYKGYLFACQSQCFNGKLFKKNGSIEYSDKKDKYLVPDVGKIRRDLNNICERYKILNEDGSIYKLTSHQLRHNGITDRIYAGFNYYEIMLMTEHQSSSMIEKSYLHRQNKMLLDKQRLINNEDVTNSNEKEVVYFKGRILNIDEKQETRLLKNLRAYKLKDLGICSDITSCENNIFECLDCKHFIPNADNLEYFKEQVKMWEIKINAFKNNEILKEKAEYNYLVFKKIVLKIEKVLTNK